jgi:hypothetical protein
MNKAAQALGALGGAVKSEEKAKASKANGKLGGRPKRSFTAPLQTERCEGNVTLSDGSGAQCMHKRQKGRKFCRQHEGCPVGLRK